MDVVAFIFAPERFRGSWGGAGLGWNCWRGFVWERPRMREFVVALVFVTFLGFARARTGGPDEFVGDRPIALPPRPLPLGTLLGLEVAREVAGDVGISGNERVARTGSGCSMQRN